MRWSSRTLVSLTLVSTLTQDKMVKENNFKQLYLYSNTKLENAIHIYLKYGFIEANIPTNNPYKRSNIKMVYPL